MNQFPLLAPVFWGGRRWGFVSSSACSTPQPPASASLCFREMEDLGLGAGKK